MGTRSLLHIQSGGETLTTIYRQYDGYPTGMGQDIYNCLGEKELVNGYSDPDKQVNGMECAAAMIIGALKKGKCGGIYIYKPDSSDCGEEYTYYLDDKVDGDKSYMTLKILSYDEEIYNGPLSEFDAEKIESD